MASAAVHSHHGACCHGHKHTESLSDRLFSMLEKVSAIALGIFSAYASLELFVPFFLAGIGVGLYQHFYSKPGEMTAGRSIGCSQGLLEQLTKVKLPPLISLAANLGITWCHIDHHTTVFVPVVGVSLGAWAGQTIGRWGSEIFKKEAKA